MDETELPKRLEPKSDVKRELYIRSGNQCAFPDCDTVLMTRDGVMIGRICHIEAAMPDGKRFNPAMSNEERRSYANLLLLCGDHHTIIDDNAERFPVKKLREMKGQHEAVRSEKLGSLQIQSEQANGAWEELSFSEGRDLRPALMGRALGPADAAACPTLPETAMILRELEAAHSARLAGVPGAGKSVCIMQVASIMKQRGWQIFRARDSSAGILQLNQTESPALYIVDDAHLAPEHVIRSVEQSTNSNSYLLATYNAADNLIETPGTTYLDPKQAVRTIAKELRANREATLRAVHAIDKTVSDRPYDESLERRLDAAEEADVPWQFCFILGGGWTRADAAASSAVSTGSHLVLAAIAARQISTRDAVASKADIEHILEPLNLGPRAIEQSIQWLAKNRLIAHQGDLRTPHQRFSAVVLKQLLRRAAEAKETDALKMVIDALVANPRSSLIGLRNLLQELRMGIGNWRFHPLVEKAHLEGLIARCWTQEGEENRNHACLLLSELQSYFDDWVGQIISDDGAMLIRWIDEATGQSAYGTGYLLGQISMKDKELCAKIGGAVDRRGLAEKLSNAKPDQVYSMSELVSNVSRSEWEEWKGSFVALLDREKLQSLANEWPDDGYLSSFAKLCSHLAYHDQEFGLDLVAKFSTRVAPRLVDNPVGSFHEMDEIFWHVLRLHDPLGLYKGKDRPSKAMRQVGRHISDIWSASDLAEKISQCSTRDFQSAAGLLLFLRKVDQNKFTEVVNRLNWSEIETTIAPQIDDLFHDADVFLSVCGMVKFGQCEIGDILSRNRDNIATLTPRLAYTAFDFAIKFIENKGVIGISNGHTFNWDWAAILLAKLHNKRPDLFAQFLAPHIENAAIKLSEKNGSWLTDPLLFLRMVRQEEREIFERILSLIDPDSAEVGWANALRGKTKTRQTAAYLVHRSLGRSDALGETAQRLRARFPSASIPPDNLLEPLT